MSCRGLVRSLTPISPQVKREPVKAALRLCVTVAPRASVHARLRLAIPGAYSRVSQWRILSSSSTTPSRTTRGGPEPRSPTSWAAPRRRAARSSCGSAHPKLRRGSPPAGLGTLDRVIQDDPIRSRPRSVHHFGNNCPSFSRCSRPRDRSRSGAPATAGPPRLGRTPRGVPVDARARLPRPQPQARLVSAQRRSPQGIRPQDRRPQPRPVAQPDRPGAGRLSRHPSPWNSCPPKDADPEEQAPV
jgi:hypothetical protein